MMVVDPSVFIYTIFGACGVGLFLCIINLISQWNRIETLAKKKDKTDSEFDNELWQLAFDAILVIVQIGIAIAIAILNRWIRGGL